MGLTSSPHLPTDASQQAQIEALAQQVQELRQVVAFLLNPFSNSGIAVGSRIAEQHYSTVTSYPRFGGL